MTVERKITYVIIPDKTQLKEREFEPSFLELTSEDALQLHLTLGALLSPKEKNK